MLWHPFRVPLLIEILLYDYFLFCRLVEVLISERDYLRGKVARSAASVEALELKAAADVEALQVELHYSHVLFDLLVELLILARFIVCPFLVSRLVLHFCLPSFLPSTIHLTLIQAKLNSSEALRVSAANAARGFRASLQNATDALAKQEAAAANATSVANELSVQVADTNAKLVKAEETIKGFKVRMSTCYSTDICRIR